MKKPLVIAVLVSLVGSSLLVGGPAAADEDCPDYVFVGARGSEPESFASQMHMGPEALEVLLSMTTRVEGPDVEMNPDSEGDDTFFLDDGIEVEPIGLPYEGNTELAFSATGRYVPDGYAESVEAGGELLETIFSDWLAASKCPNAQFILVGFSQGADALGAGIHELSSLQRGHIAAVGLMGDTKFNGADKAANRGSYVPYLNGVVATRQIWNQVLPGIPVFSYCRNGDVACNSRNDEPLDGWTTRTFDAVHVGFWAYEHGQELITEHEQYDDQNDTVRLATDIQLAIGVPCTTIVENTSAEISGKTRVHVGEIVAYSGIGSVMSACNYAAWSWSVGGNSDSVSARAVFGTVPSETEIAAVPASLENGSLLRDDPEEPEEPAETEPYFETVFEAPGYQTVGVEVETEDGTMYGSLLVEVLPAPSTAPSIPLLTRSVTTDDQLLLSWSSGGNVPADGYVITDPNGDPVDAVLPVEEEGLDGVENFEFVVPDWELTDSTEYDIVAVNDVGETDSRLVLEADSATYSHQILSGATPIGGTFALSGSTTPELEDAEAESLVSPIVPIDGTYEARLIAPASEISIDMSEVAAELTVDEGEWELEFDFGDDLDANDYPISQTMREGFADALLEDGLITFEIYGVDFVVSINEDTETEQVNKYVINTNATVPDGIETDEYSGSATSGNVELIHDGIYDTARFPAWDESLDPSSNDWTTTVASDVHVYIGNDEVVHTGQVFIYALDGPTSEAEPTVSLGLWGQIGDGSYLTMRSFLEDGAVSFRLDGGEPNVMALDATSTLAAELYPEPLPPEFLDDDEVVVDQGEEVLWYPSVDWSVWGGGPVEITADALPSGMQIEWWGAISGIPAESGVYPFTVKATNGTGSTVRGYQLIVKSRDLPATDAVYEHRIWPGGVADNGELTLSGNVNERLDGILTENPGTPSLLGEYEAAFIPVNGDPMNYDMSAADVDFESDGDTWELTFAFGDALDTGNLLIWDRMRHGLAEQLLAGSTIYVQVDGTPINLVVNNVTDTEENNRWVVDPSPTVPGGVNGDRYFGSLEFDMVEFVHDGAYDPLLFPAGALLSGDPEDTASWFGTDVSDVHVYIGSQEISFDGELAVWAAGPTSVDENSIDVALTGQIGDGSYLTYRDVLENGTVSFRVNGGDMNVISFDATSTQAEAAFPTPTAPEILGGDITYKQFDRLHWTPWISWGGVTPGTYTISSPHLPNGVGIYISDGVYYIGDVVLAQGEYEIEVTATNEIGTTTRAMTLVIGPSVAKDHFETGGVLTRNGDGTLSLQMRRSPDPVYADNATIQQWLPAVGEAGIGVIGDPWGYEVFTATDVHLYLASGAEVPITGTFEVTIQTGWSFDLHSSDMTIGDNTTATINSLWKQAVRVTFRRGTGEVNKVWKAALPSYSL